MSRFLVIPRIRVEHANALSAWWLMATPSPMTVYGFARALGLHGRFSSRKIALAHHDVYWLAREKQNTHFIRKPEGGREGETWDVRFFNQKVLPQQPQGATLINRQDHIQSGFSKSLQPTARYHVTLSVVIDLAEHPVHIEEVKDFLWAGKLNGGAIVEHGKPEICASSEEVARKLGGGFWVVDRSDLVLQAMRGSDGHPGRDGTEALIHVLGENARQRILYERDKTQLTKPPEAWLSANTIGYTALEKFRERSGVREGLPHAYAEPMVGLVQFSPIRKTSRVPFWQYYNDPEKGLYLMKGV